MSRRRSLRGGGFYDVDTGEIFDKPRKIDPWYVNHPDRRGGGDDDGVIRPRENWAEKAMAWTRAAFSWD